MDEINFFLFTLYHAETDETGKRHWKIADHGRIGRTGDDFDDVICRFSAIIAYSSSLYVRDGKARKLCLSDWRQNDIRIVQFGQL